MHLGQQVLFPCSVKMGCNESHSTIPRLATIFLWAASVTFPCFVNGDGCRMIQFKEQKQNVALANHVIRNEQVFDRDICELKCYQEPNCVSYNYGPSGDGKLVCELSNKTHLQVPSDDLQMKDDFIYRQITDNACQSNPCKSNSTCQAGFGVHGYRCIFPEVNCGESCESDVDECAMNTHNCSANADCSNAMEPFQCTCKSGYSGDGSTCLDVDECTIATHYCSSNADCSNAVGSFRCTCESGYTGDGKTCEDVDECTMASHDCSSNANCSNSVGSFQCTCRTGYTGDGKTCQDNDECTMNTHDCSSNADCSNVMGSFQCACKSGYTGDGKACQDLDECATANHSCSIHAHCSNVIGSFQCTCNDGYSGDGKTCQAFGSAKEVPFSSCKSLSSFNLPTGVYWLDIDGGSHDNAFKAYCEMETDGGGWTLVWSYTFTNYQSFSTPSNAITPRPTWDVKNSDDVNVPTSNTPPLNETDFNAIEFSKWATIGDKVLIKSNINNWIICSGTGSLPQWQYGSVNCIIVKNITEHCLGEKAPAYFGRNYQCGPAYKLKGGDYHYYYFDGCTGEDFPAHDPCGSYSDKELKNIQNPHGNIFIR